LHKSHRQVGLFILPNDRKKACFFEGIEGK